LQKIGEDSWATGRKETFEIGENERLIGFEADHCAEGQIYGLTLVKWTVK
jgi:hypothetical protein